MGRIGRRGAGGALSDQRELVHHIEPLLPVAVDEAAPHRVVEHLWRLLAHL